METNYDYQSKFKRLFDKAVEQYGNGNRDGSSYFDEEEHAFIKSNGWRVQDFYDYGEDMVLGSEPSYEIAQSIEQVRREYFLHIQNSEQSSNVISSAALPPKADELGGVKWLPRIIPKAIAKLKGELPDDTMYCCGGDRAFLKRHDIHPSEFLRVVWANLDDTQGIVDFVKSRSPQA